VKAVVLTVLECPLKILLTDILPKASIVDGSTAPASLTRTGAADTPLRRHQPVGFAFVGSCCVFVALR
jgi:hypothetical protein